MQVLEELGKLATLEGGRAYYTELVGLDLQIPPFWLSLLFPAQTDEDSTFCIPNIS
jgi:hypothetical protein